MTPKILKTSTYFALLAEFGTAQIPVELVSEKYFGLAPATAIRHAAQNRLPIPSYRMGSQKSPWLVDAADLALLIDVQREEARRQWDRANV